MLKYKSKMHIDNLKHLYDEIDDSFEQYLKVLADEDPRYKNISKKQLESMYISFCYGYLKAQENFMHEFKQVH